MSITEVNSLALLRYFNTPTLMSCVTLSPSPPTLTFTFPPNPPPLPESLGFLSQQGATPLTVSALTMTTYYLAAVNKETKQKEPLTLLSSYLQLTKANNFAQYFAECKKYNVAWLTLKEKAGFVKFMSGGKEKRKRKGEKEKEGKEKEKSKSKSKRDSSKSKKPRAGESGEGGDKKKTVSLETIMGNLKKTQEKVGGMDDVDDGDDMDTEGDGGDKILSTKVTPALLAVGSLKVDSSSGKARLARDVDACKLIVAGETNVAATDVQLRSVTHKDLAVALSHYYAVFPKNKTDMKSKKKKEAVEAKKSPKVLGNPIVIIPNALTAPINMFNAAEFFENANYLTTAEAKKRKGSSVKPKMVEVVRNIPKTDKSLTFEIIDSPMKLTVQDWERVVAVVVQGKAWQFKGWTRGNVKFENPVEIFAKTFGFYAGFEGDELPEDVKQWTVKQSKLNRDKRGLDSVTNAQFWQQLFEWLKVHRPEVIAA